MTGFLEIRRAAAGYPALLAELHDPPASLFVRGGTDVLALPGVAVVGARSCSAYGAQVARSLARELAAAGVGVVSGLARGVDGEAHRGALEAGGVTVAVLGCGIDRDYPRSHTELARRIVGSGAVVSEYPAGVEPAPWRFPARNRIIAGLALATVVVEARERSGALITADFALELGRDVFAVPGEITSALSAGTNDLLRQGAAPLTSTRDVFEAIGIEQEVRAAPEVSTKAAALLSLLADGARPADELIRASALPSGDVAAALVELELAGLVAQSDGVYRSFSPGRSSVAPARA
ncbi:MAG TPA: DNA-processing protein DprA [Gaiellaceae bacterium]|jgi:DNA processing protein|nr:DNA-processing protein DprA [Gaiellaceae bacterium]